MQHASILTIPPEVVENVVVYCASGGFPTAVAVLARTCRALRALIYNSSDRHLWREIYLATFDDPRKLYYAKPATFDWCSKFTQRIWTQSFIRRHTQPLRVQKVYNLRSRSAASVVDLKPTYDIASSVRALAALISVIQTSAPCRSAQTEPSTASTPRPVLNTRSLTHASLVTRTFPDDDPTWNESLNVAWLQDLLSRGLPPPLIAKISGKRRDVRWDKTAQAQALGQLLCYTGFLPVRELQEERTTRLASSSSSRRNEEASISGLAMTMEAQHERAHLRARELAYNMEYLQRRRNWGPYLPVATASNSTASPRHAPAGNGPSSPAHFLSRFNPDSDSETDSDFVPAGDQASFTSGSSQYASSDEHSEPEPQRDASEARRKKRFPPSDDQLTPDWLWLSAARIICERNMRQIIQQPLGELLNWNAWRECAWVWPEHSQKQTVEADQYGESSEWILSKADNAESKKGEGTVVDGPAHSWDWAGVEGVWRRCVSWLDYADLIHHNVYGHFNPALEESMIIVPLRLRVVGYRSSTVRADPDRPTILVEGEMGGADWVGAPEEVGDDVRKVYGTVSVISDGSVRWCITSSTEDDPDEDQWVSEAIQIGGVGSTVGMLGLWTGARHDVDDPLGPFWQWKVA